ncbi:phosphoglycerate mutase-like protein [Martensiomyces pterosporus]|nr:phosphoglycerate mutase-like protein [Martensiomyces pterosporus]
MPLPTAYVPGSLQLVHVEYIVRHGARYPTKSDMERFRHIFGKLRHSVPRSWIKDELITEAYAGDLAASGVREIEGIAQRAAARYSLLFERSSGSSYSTGLRFISSESQRSQKSARAFRKILSDSYKTLPVEVIPRINDTVLAMKYSCPLWAKESDRLMDSIKRQVATFDAIHGSALQKHVNRRLSADLRLSINDISTLYLLCGYDMSLFVEHGHWCTLLSPHIASLLELRADIRYSRVFGPDGAEINRKMACSLFTQMFDSIDQVLKHSGMAMPVFRFGHAETIMFASTLLGLENALGNGSAPITGNMPLKEALLRGFRTSVLAPFSSNLALEIYQDRYSQAYFRLLINENSIRLPLCPDSICPLRILREMLSDDIGCTFASMCHASDH